MCMEGRRKEDLLCGPGAACAAGDMCEVGDDECAVVCGFALDADAFAAAAVGVEVRGCVDAHVDLVIFGL
jgi:hypothetical protein